MCLNLLKLGYKQKAIRSIFCKILNIECILESVWLEIPERQSDTYYAITVALIYESKGGALRSIGKNYF